VLPTGIALTCETMITIIRDADEPPHEHKHHTWPAQACGFNQHPSIAEKP
jgi:hypothetical protein